MKYTYEQLAKMIDHSLLHPTLTDQEFRGARDGVWLHAHRCHAVLRGKFAARIKLLVGQCGVQKGVIDHLRQLLVGIFHGGPVPVQKPVFAIKMAPFSTTNAGPLIRTPAICRSFGPYTSRMRNGSSIGLPIFGEVL